MLKDSYDAIIIWCTSTSDIDSSNPTPNGLVFGTKYRYICETY